MLMFFQMNEQKKPKWIIMLW